MKKFARSSAILVFVILVQLLVYEVFIRSYISTWGATNQEVAMTLPGDENARSIGSTRAIVINATISDVWRWVIQLGADRGGFFSYTFIEKALGYETNDTLTAYNTFNDFEVGRIIPGSTGTDSVIEYNFEVVTVDPGKSFFLKNWGAFFLKQVDENQTRLIIRSHSSGAGNWLLAIGNYIMQPLHYLMERRMMLGFKSWAETGKAVAQTSDILWFLGIVFSGFGVVLSPFFLRNINRVVLPNLFAFCWLLSLLVLYPNPVYGFLLFLLILAILISHVLRKQLE